MHKSQCRSRSNIKKKIHNISTNKFKDTKIAEIPDKIENFTLNNVQ
jgi:hypothetical protein